MLLNFGNPTLALKLEKPARKVIEVWLRPYKDLHKKIIMLEPIEALKDVLKTMKMSTLRMAKESHEIISDFKDNTEVLNNSSNIESNSDYIIYNSVNDSNQPLI